MDPAMRWIVGGKASHGCAASPSQMGRFETRWLTAEKNLSALADLSGRWIDCVHARRPPRGGYRRRSGLSDLWRKAVAAIADFLHPLGYRTASGTASPKRRDNATASHSRSIVASISEKSPDGVLLQLPIEAADFSQSPGLGTAITAVRFLSALLAVRRRAGSTACRGCSNG